MRDTTVERVLVEEYKPCILAITNSNKPWIAAVSGPASGIGAAFAQACDLMIMGEGAYIYMAFAAIALVPDGGNTWQMVRQLGYRRAFEAIIEGHKIRLRRRSHGDCRTRWWPTRACSRRPRLGSPAGPGGAACPSRQEGPARRHGSGSGGDHRSGIGARTSIGSKDFAEGVSAFGAVSRFKGR